MKPKSFNAQIEFKHLKLSIKKAERKNDYSEIVKQIISIAKELDKSSFDKDRIGFGEDFCGTWDDYIGSWKSVPGIKDFVINRSSELTEEEREIILHILLKRYASHEPGGRTACLEMFTYLLPSIPQGLMDYFIYKVANSTIDRTYLKKGSSLNLLSHIATIVLNNKEQLEIISLRFNELCEDDDAEVKKLSKKIMSQKKGLKKLSNSRKTLISKKNDDSYIIRWGAVLAMGKSNDMFQYFWSLIKSLDDTSHWVRSAAAFSLGKIGNKMATDKLIESLDRDKDEYVRVRCAYAIGKLSDQAALWRLMAIYDKEINYCVRFAIKYAISQIQPSKAIELSLQDLKSENPSVRLFGAEDLRKIKWNDKKMVKSAVLSLISHIHEEPFQSVKKTLIETINMLGTKKDISYVKKMMAI